MTLPSVRTIIDRLTGVGIESKHFAAALEFDARAGHLEDGFRARTEQLRAEVAEDLATGRVDLEQALSRVGDLVARQAVEVPGALKLVNRDVVTMARARCQVLAWQELRKAAPEIDAETRGRLAGIDEQIGKLDAQLPEEARGGGSLPSSAGRKVIGLWGEAIDARRRREEVAALRAELRAAGLVEATAEEAAAEAAAEEGRLRRVRGEVSYRMTTEAAKPLLHGTLAGGFDQLVSAALPKGA